MSRGIENGLLAIWAALKETEWYGGLNLEEDSPVQDCRRSFSPELFPGPFLSYQEAVQLIDRSLTAVLPPDLIVAFAEGLRGAALGEGPEAPFGPREFMRFAGAVFSPLYELGTRETRFGSLTETGVLYPVEGMEQGFFTALAYFAFAANGLGARFITSNPVDPSPELPIPLGDVGEEYPGGGGGGDGDAMILEFTFPSEEGPEFPYTLELPIYHDPLEWVNEYAITVDWGDESEPEEFAYTDEQTPQSSVTHSYAAAGVYEVSITGVLPIFGVPGLN